jgi:hypothetical protein
LRTKIILSLFKTCKIYGEMGIKLTYAGGFPFGFTDSLQPPFGGDWAPDCGGVGDGTVWPPTVSMREAASFHFLLNTMLFQPGVTVTLIK